jgi:hypothetical protein
LRFLIFDLCFEDGTRAFQSKIKNQKFFQVSAFCVTWGRKVPGGPVRWIGSQRAARLGTFSTR